jgi:hypothetical protein
MNGSVLSIGICECLTMEASLLPEVQQRTGSNARDIRHLIVCLHPISLRRCAAYHEARALVLLQTAAGHQARIVLVTNELHDIAGIQLDVPIDVLPVFAKQTPGNLSRINRNIFPCIFSSLRDNTEFHIHDTPHPILRTVLHRMREQGISFSVRSVKFQLKRRSA